MQEYITQWSNYRGIMSLTTICKIFSAVSLDLIVQYTILKNSQSINNRSDFLSMENYTTTPSFHQFQGPLWKHSTGKREFDISNVRSQKNLAGLLSKPIIITNGLRKGEALSSILSNLALENVIHDGHVDARGTNLFKCSWKGKP